MKTPEEWMRSFEGKIAESQAKAAAVKEGLANAGGSATSPYGAVTVSVAPTGALTDLRLTPAAMAKPPAQLAAEIMAAARKAQRGAAAKVADAFAAAGGAGSETHRMITEYIPPEEPEPVPPPAPAPQFVPAPVEDDVPPPPAAPPAPQSPLLPQPPARPRRPAREDDGHDDGDFSDDSIFKKR